MKGWFCQYNCSVSVTLSALSRKTYSNDFPVMGPLRSTHTHTLNEHSGAYTQYCELFKEESDQTESALIRSNALRTVVSTFISMMYVFFTYQVDGIMQIFIHGHCFYCMSYVQCSLVLFSFWNEVCLSGCPQEDSNLWERMINF